MGIGEAAEVSPPRYFSVKRQSQETSSVAETRRSLLVPREQPRCDDSSRLKTRGFYGFAPMLYRPTAIDKKIVLSVRETLSAKKR